MLEFVFGGASEKIEGDGTDLVISANNLTVDAAADIILDAAGNDFLLNQVVHMFYQLLIHQVM